MQQENHLNIFNSKSDFPRDNLKPISFPFSSKTDAIDPKYRYYERKTEFDTPKISSRFRSFQKVSPGFTSASLNGNGSYSVLGTNTSSFTSVNPVPTFQLSSFLKRPDDGQKDYTSLHSQFVNRQDIIKSLRGQHEKPQTEISEYEHRIGQKVNRKVALTIFPLFCIVYGMSILLDFIICAIYNRQSLFFMIFGIGLNFQRLLRCSAIVLPLISYKKIFFGSDLDLPTINFPILVKFVLMGAVYIASSVLCFFSFFHKTMNYFPESRDSLYIDFKPVFLFGYALIFGLYRLVLFVSRRESVLIYQWYPATFKWVSINHSIYLMSLFSFLFIIFHRIYCGVILFVPRILLDIQMVSLRSFSLSDVFFMALVLLYSHLLANLWSFDHFLILKEMTCNPRIVEIMPKGIISAIPGLESPRIHLRMLAYIDIINAFGRSEIQRSHVWEDIDSRPTAWALIRNSCVKVLREWNTLVSKSRMQLISFEKDIISNQDDSIWLSIRGIPELAMIFEALFKASLFYSDYEQALLAIELSRLIILFSYEEDRYGLVQGDLGEIVKLYIDTILEIESFSDSVPVRNNKWAEFILDAIVRSSGSYYGTSDPMGSVLIECVNTIHEMYRVFEKDLLDLDLPIRYKNKMSSILAAEKSGSN